MKANWRERIVIEPAIHHGEPCIKGTRVPVSVIVGSVADGDTPQQIIDAWPQLTGDDIKAALKFAAEAVNNADSVPLQRTNGRRSRALRSTRTSRGRLPTSWPLGVMTRRP